MQSHWSRRVMAALVAGALVAQTGCSGGWQSLDREELVEPEPAKSYLVTMKNGDQMTFISLHLEGEWLEGTRRITLAEAVGEGETGRRNVTNRYEETRLPWAEVAVVEAEAGPKSDHSLWLAVGAIAAGVATFIILTGDSVKAPPDDGGGGKTP